MVPTPSAEHRSSSAIAGVPPGLANTTTARAAVVVSAEPAAAITCGLSPQLAQVGLLAVILPAARLPRPLLPAASC